MLDFILVGVLPLVGVVVRWPADVDVDAEVVLQGCAKVVVETCNMS